MSILSTIAFILIGLSLLISVLYTICGLRISRCPNKKCRSILVFVKTDDVYEKECLGCGSTLIFYPDYTVRTKL